MELYIWELNPMHVFWFLFNQLVPMGPLFHALLPSLGRFGSCAFSGRLRFRFVRLVQALPSSPPSSGLGPFPSPSGFLFPCPFRVCPLRARCVGVCFLLPFLSCVPLSGSGQVFFHLIFIVVSPSSCLISTFTPRPGPELYFPTSVGCVYLWHV